MIEASPSPLPLVAPSTPRRSYLDFFRSPPPESPPPPPPPPRVHADAPRRLAEGDVIGDWEVLEYLGSGGMSDVFAAFYRPGHKRYALKVLRHDQADDPMAVRRFELEYLALTRVKHEAIVAPFLAGRERGVRFYAMELLDGESLDRIYNRALVDPLRAAKIGIAVAQALSRLHTRGIIHRDLKPANIFILRDGGVKLLDLGIAKLLPAFYVDVEMRPPPEDRPQTGVGVYIGTPGYMAPEAALGAAAAPAQDIFGLAVTLYRVITGGIPFPPPLPPGPGDEPLPPASFGRTIPPALEEVLRRALSVDPSLRQASMESLCDQLTGAVQEIEAELAEDQRARSDAKGDDQRGPPDAPIVEAPATALSDPADEPAAAVAAAAEAIADPGDAPASVDHHDPAGAPAEASADPPTRRERPHSSRRWSLIAYPTLLVVSLAVAFIVGDLAGAARESAAQSETGLAARLGRAVVHAVGQVPRANEIAAPAPEIDGRVEAESRAEIDDRVEVEADDPPALEPPPSIIDATVPPAAAGSPTAPARRRGLNRTAFREAIAPQRAALALCVRDDPGKVAHQIIVDVRPSGEVDDLRITPAASYIATRCIDRTVRGVHFPQAPAPSTHRITLDAPEKSERP